MSLRAVALSLALISCSSAGPYGYSRTYAPLDEEETALANARELDPVMSRRSPEDWRNARVSVFGVIKNRRDAGGGAAYLTLSMRRLADRNLCDDADPSSCRVTVSEREHALLHVVARLSGADDIGERSVAPGSLVRVVGRLADGVDPRDGAPVLSALYYRHWPRAEYVTTADSEHMRR